MPDFDLNEDQNLPYIALGNPEEPLLNAALYHIENGSFLRMKTLTVGYSLPASLRSKLKLSNARIYLQAQNLFTITNYSGADPEGLGYPYALPRQYTVGIQFGF